MTDRTDHGEQGQYRDMPSLDPSPRTWEALAREVSALKELFGQRFLANDEAVKLFNDNLTRVPTETQKAVSAMQLLLEEKIAGLKAETTQKFTTVDEKFTGVEKGFTLRDKASETSSAEAKTNIKDALAAAEKQTQQASKAASDAVAKNEDQTTKQIDGIKNLVEAGTKSTDERAAEMRERLTRLEGLVTAQVAAVAVAQQSQQTIKTDQHSSSSFTLSLVMGAVGIAGFVMALIEILRHP